MKKNKQMYKLVSKSTYDNSVSSVSSTSSRLSGVNTNIDSQLDSKIAENDEKISEGLLKETASTGTPIKSLRGAAVFTAKLSNIGGGSKKTDGGGMQEGIQIIVQNSALKGLKKGLKYHELSATDTTASVSQELEGNQINK